MTNIMLSLKKIPYLNGGGCGIAALAAHRKYKQMGINSRIVYLHNAYDGSAPKISENNRNKIGASAYHYALLVDELGLIDADGSLSLEEKSKKWWCDVVVRIVPECFLIEGIKNGGWNSAFDRRTGIPAIERILNVNLEDIK